MTESRQGEKCQMVTEWIVCQSGKSGGIICTFLGLVFVHVCVAHAHLPSYHPCGVETGYLHLRLTRVYSLWIYILFFGSHWARLLRHYEVAGVHAGRAIWGQPQRPGDPCRQPPSAPEGRSTRQAGEPQTESHQDTRGRRMMCILFPFPS